MTVQSVADRPIRAQLTPSEETRMLGTARTALAASTAIQTIETTRRVVTTTAGTPRLIGMTKATIASTILDGTQAIAALQSGPIRTSQKVGIHSPL